jgi:hypothetical protein
MSPAVDATSARPGHVAEEEPDLPSRALREDVRVRVNTRVEIEAVTPPDWLDADQALAVADSGWLGGAVPPTPPIQARRARAVLARLASTRRPSRRLDIDVVVDRAARAQPPKGLPVLLEHRTAPAIDVLLDMSEAMEPYAHDLTFLSEQLVQTLGEERVRIAICEGAPTGGHVFGAASRDVVAWKPPGPGALVVAITDMGVGGPRGTPRHSQGAGWQAFAKHVAEYDARLRVLTPFPIARAPAGLEDVSDIVPWDGLDDLLRAGA